jgi:hypothetical protein
MDVVENWNQQQSNFVLSEKKGIQDSSIVGGAFIGSFSVSGAFATIQIDLAKL